MIKESALLFSEKKQNQQKIYSITILRNYTQSKYSTQE